MTKEFQVRIRFKDKGDQVYSWISGEDFIKILEDKAEIKAEKMGVQNE